MARKRWSELDPRTRRIIVVGGTVDVVLRAVALADLKGRSSAEVRGSRPAWAAAIALVSSGGLLPLAYLLRGRRPRT